MATNLAINDKLLKEALLISGFKTKKDTVNLAAFKFAPDINTDTRKMLSRYSQLCGIAPITNHGRSRCGEIGNRNAI
jgi:hypothetical protein